MYEYTCMSDLCQGQKRVLDVLEMESQIIVSHHVGSENWPRSSGRTTNTLSHWAPSPVPVTLLLTEGIFCCFQKLLHHFYIDQNNTKIQVSPQILNIYPCVFVESHPKIIDVLPNREYSLIFVVCCFFVLSCFPWMVNDTEPLWTLIRHLFVSVEETPFAHFKSFLKIRFCFILPFNFKSSLRVFELTLFYLHFVCLLYWAKDFCLL